MDGALKLADGTVFRGQVHGAVHNVSGEVVFQTGMVGYVESLTDPSYHGQILVLTYPLIGNYGVPDGDAVDLHGLRKWMESRRVWPVGVVVSELCTSHSHWNAKKSLGEWLTEQNVPIIEGVDTRALTEKLRDAGTVLGQIAVDGMDLETEQFTADTRNLMAEVSVKEPSLIYNAGGSPRILVIDCGLKYNQLRCLLARGACLQVFPWNHPLDKEMLKFDGLFLSNGPGDPALSRELIENLAGYMKSSHTKPIFGICMGHQIIALAAGLKTYRLKYGNRGHNQPCIHRGTGRCYITSQNHGYAADVESLPKEWEILFTNANDGTNEGLIHAEKPIFSVQFHPEHMAGPADTEWLFDVFLDAVRLHVSTGRCAGLAGMITDKCQAAVAPCPVSAFKPRKVVILGSGGLTIGQAGEFDYCGAQAIKALKEEGVHTILINPNVATSQTTKGLADTVYFLPVDVDYVTQVIEAERPDGILLNFGGQTALNCGVKLVQDGILARYNVTVLGTPVQTVIWTEDRKQFADKLAEIGYRVAPSAVAYSTADALAAADLLGFPLLVRAAYSLGGLNSGFATNRKQLLEICTKALTVSTQLFIDKSLRGWKEVEYEVVRDVFDNCITVCNMENLDPLGVHTGDSVVVAPSQTLSNTEYNMLRTAAIHVVRHLGVVGECNIQYALDPKSHEFFVVEVNARLSRSSALASKATGFPLAFIAAKLAIGHNLATLRNPVTGVTTACFEPSLDYVVVKIPRWDLDKFTGVSRKIGSAMKSIGEGMAIGRGFEEAFQKALRMVSEDYLGFDPYKQKLNEEELVDPSDKRILVIATALAEGYTVEHLHQLTQIDPWFLAKMKAINDFRVRLSARKAGRDGHLDFETLLAAKKLGFCDQQIANCVGSQDYVIRARRKDLHIHPWVKQIDTVAAEWPACANYLYTTYHSQQHDVTFNNTADGDGRPAVMVLGSGIYRIGSSVEFDCCAVGCLEELRRCGRKTIMINCNPETVSTDYDKCDRLYFEEISLECVTEIYELESPAGVILSMGGQLPNNIALALKNVPTLKILGTSAESIDNAEDRFKFSRTIDMVKSNGNPEVCQPLWRTFTNFADAKAFCDSPDVGYPVLIRPSYVLSGAAMNVAQSADDLHDYLAVANRVRINKDHPVVISKFIENAKEIDVDAVACGGELVCMAVSEHVENAGVHSGDATLVTPPQDLNDETLAKIKKIVMLIGDALKVNGPYNLQLIAKDNELKVIECNLRVSRSFPFVSKTLDYDFVAAATRVALGEKVTPVGMLTGTPNRVGVKAPMFSFSRLTDADVNLGVEMCSTGEVAGYGVNRHEAFLKAAMSSGFVYPKGAIFVSVGNEKHKLELLPGVTSLRDMGYKLYGSKGTAEFYTQNGVKVDTTEWPEPESPPNGAAGDYANGNGETSIMSFDLVINIPSRKSGARRASSLFIAGRGTRGYRTRRTAVEQSTSLITDIKVAKLLIESMCEYPSPPPLRRATDAVSSRRLARLPGLIDVHVHMREPGATNKEDFASGTAAALAGGVTLVCCMPNTDPPVINKSALATTQACASTGARCDYALFVGASPDNAVSVARLAPQAFALKMYLNCTFSTLELTDMSLWAAHFKNWPKDRVICVHAEGHTLGAVLAHAIMYRRRMHICHVSRKDEILLIKEAKAQGYPITCEVAPHHLFMTQDDLKQLGGRGAVKPPLATQEDQTALWDNMDTIDCFATDHAPHLPHEKDRTTPPPPPGFPGLETMLPLLLTAVHEGRLRLQDIVEKLHDNPKRIFDLPDQPDTYVEVDLDEEWSLPTETTFSKAKWTPFAGFHVRGRVHRVVLRGRDVFLDDQILAEPGFGKDVRVDSFFDTTTAAAAASLAAKKPGHKVPSEPYLNGWGSHGPELGDGDRAAKPPTVIATPTAPSKPPPALRSSSSLGFAPSSSASVIEAPPLRPVSGLSVDSTTLPNQIVSVSQFSKALLGPIFWAAERIKADIKIDKPLEPILRGKVMACMFYEVSTRTMNSFAAAMQRLGGSVVYMDPQSSSVQKGESLEDSVAIMASYADVVVLRHPEPGAASRAAKRCGLKPFINAGDGTGEHPTQALLDVFTIRDELGTVKDLTITMVGDLKHGRTVHSLAKLLTLYRVKEIRYLAPKGLGMPTAIRDYVTSKGISQVDCSSLEEALPDTHVLYMTRIQKERFASEDEYRAAFGKFVLTPELMTLALPESREGRKMRVLHPLPRLAELSVDLDTDPRAAYFRQAENGLYVRMALLGMLIKGKDAFA